MTNWHYRVELLRRVGTSQWPCTISTFRKEFPFGKTKEYSIGKDAERAATRWAYSMLDEANEVSVWLSSGAKGSGGYIKRDPDARFRYGFEDQPPKD